MVSGESEWAEHVETKKGSEGDVRVSDLIEHVVIVTTAVILFNWMLSVYSSRASCHRHSNCFFHRRYINESCLLNFTKGCAQFVRGECFNPTLPLSSSSCKEV